MTRTEWVALAVLAAAAAAGGLRYAQPDATAPDSRRAAAPDVLGAQAPAAASGPNAPARRGETHNPDGHGDRGGNGAAADTGRRVAPPGVGRVIGVRPAPRQVVQDRVPAAGWDAGSETAPPIALEASGVAPREATPPVARAPYASDAAEDGHAEEAAAASDGGEGVLLSIPLHGAVEPEEGTGPPPQTSGLVSNGGTIEFTEDAQYTLPAGGHVNSEAGTISFTVQPNWAGADETNNSLLQIRDEHRWENSLGIVKNYNSLRYIIHDQQGVETNVNIYINDWQPNQPHLVTATWDDARMTLSVDGVQVGETPLQNPLQFGATTPIHIGSDFPGSTYRGADARISDLTVQGTAPPPAAGP